jgi:STE24 endopeptidase
MRQYFKSKSKSIPDSLKNQKHFKMSEAEIVKSKAYNADKMALTIVRTTIDLVVMAFLLMMNYYPLLWEFLVNSTGNMYLSIFIFTLVDSLRSSIFDLPFSYYSTFSIEERYGFNKTTLKTFVTDQIKNLVLGLVLGGTFFCLLTVVVEYFAENFLFVSCLGSSIFLLFVIFLYPIVIMPMFNKFEPLNQENEKEKQVYDELITLCKKIGFPLTNLYKMDGSKRSAHSQAFFFGFLNKKKIVIYDTLLENVAVKEIVAIVGHELGHWKHKHNIAMLVLQNLFIYLFLGLFSLFLNSDKFYYDFGFSNKYPFMGITLFSIFFSPVSIILSALICAITRRNEFQADRFSVTLGMGEDLAKGLIQIFKDNNADLDPDHLFALFNHTHPGLSERLDALNLEMAKHK